MECPASDKGHARRALGIEWLGWKESTAEQKNAFPDGDKIWGCVSVPTLGAVSISSGLFGTFSSPVHFRRDLP